MMYGKGYRTQSGKHCTIMGGPTKRCVRISFFSSPRIKVMNEPATDNITYTWYIKNKNMGVSI